MPLSLLADLFKPVYYYLELQVSAQSIPNVASIAGRKKLSDHPVDKAKKLLFDHSKWDAVLKRHVKVGTGTIGDVSCINMLDYAGVTTDADFQTYLTQLEEVDPATLQPAEQLAFWMNAYNALCINIIVQHEKKSDVKIGSINEITTDKNPVWGQVAGKVGGQDISLNDIEHEKLRKEWDEPMLHACIVCASASCPNIRPEAFVVSKQKEQMEDQMRDWMKNDSKGIKLTKKGLELSRIFLWFGADFGKWDGIKEFLPQFIDDEMVQKKVAEGSVTVRYFEYGWQINRA